MYSGKLIVLKFGGSVLRSRDEQFIAAQEIYRWYSDGYRVIAVVSALFGETDRRLQKIRSIGDEVSENNVAKLVACGERESAAELGLILDECGLPNSVLFESEIGLHTDGSALDARPVELDAQLLKSQLDQTPVVVVPGFIGIDPSGSTTLLGRGGSDLTALFVAAATNADRCRLVKDVAGLYEFDPNAGQQYQPRRFRSLSWEHAQQLDECILQPKAVRFAQQNQIEFEVARPLGDQFTRVGPFPVRYFRRSVEQAVKLRVGIIGLGTAGLGVARQLNRLNQFVDIVSIGVKNIARHRGNEFDHLLTDDWREVVNSDCDLIVELVGGTDVALEIVLTSLELGKHVVTANKALVAGYEKQLVQALATSGRQLFYSAAVGGAVPMLEMVRWLSQRHEIVELQGVLNGTTNFVLGQLASGQSLQEAVALAQQKGLAEGDSARDLDGIDALEKLVLLSRAAGLPVAAADVERESLAGFLDEQTDPIVSNGVRQVATLSQDNQIPKGRIELQNVSIRSFAHSVKGRQNGLLVRTSQSNDLVIVGDGAGRWPTTISVVADLLRIGRCAEFRRKTHRENAEKQRITVR